MWWNIIKEGHKHGCGLDMISLAAIASTQNSMFLRPMGVLRVAEMAHRRFASPTSDHITQLNLLHAYYRVKGREPAVDLEQWCLEAFVDATVVEEVFKIRQQLRDMVQSILGQTLKGGLSDDQYETNIAKALARGMPHNIAFHKIDDVYVTVHENFPALLEPNSVLVSKKVQWIVYDHITHVGKSYIDTATRVKPEWLVVSPCFHIT